MAARLLLDTHVLVRWLIDSKRLSREQFQALERASARREPLAFSAITLLEIAVLAGDGKLELNLSKFFAHLEGNPEFQLLPLSPEIAADAGSLSRLRDPADRAIVATARVHGRRLVTSDERIVDSGLVPTL